MAAAAQRRLQIAPIPWLQAADGAIWSIHPVETKFVLQQRTLAHRLDPQIHRLPIASWCGQSRSVDLKDHIIKILIPTIGAVLQIHLPEAIPQVAAAGMIKLIWIGPIQGE